MWGSVQLTVPENGVLLFSGGVLILLGVSISLDPGSSQKISFGLTFLPLDLSPVMIFEEISQIILRYYQSVII